MDARSYLLDFKCIDDTKADSDAILNRRRSGNVSMCFDGSCSGEPFSNFKIRADLPSRLKGERKGELTD